MKKDKAEAEYCSLLRKNNLKITPARIGIFRLLAKSGQPLTAEMIFGTIKDKSIDRVTVYRTIELLVKLKIIGRVDLRGGSVHYELLGNHHHHIVCTNCGVLEDFESCKIEQVSKNILSKSKKFKVISDHSFELFGVCKLCI
jgi:Fe2+ or Zn2+ uptake regulation protein